MTGVESSKVASEEGDGVACDANVSLDARVVEFLVQLRELEVRDVTRALLRQNDICCAAIALGLEEDHLLQPQVHDVLVEISEQVLGALGVRPGLSDGGAPGTDVTATGCHTPL